MPSVPGSRLTRENTMRRLTAALAVAALVMCDAPNAAGIVVMDSATDPVSENNTLVAVG